MHGLNSTTLEELFGGIDLDVRSVAACGTVCSTFARFRALLGADIAPLRAFGHLSTACHACISLTGAESGMVSITSPPNRIVQVFDSYWRPLESGDVWHKSRRSRKKNDPTLKAGGIRAVLLLLHDSPV